MDQHYGSRTNHLIASHPRSVNLDNNNKMKYTRQLFLRLVAACYFLAFASLYIQWDGLFGIKAHSLAPGVTGANGGQSPFKSMVDDSTPRTRVRNQYARQGRVGEFNMEDSLKSFTDNQTEEFLLLNLVKIILNANFS